MVFLEKKRILCVDDSGDDCELLSFILTEKGYEVKSARSFIKALPFIENSLFDIGLFDIFLGDGTGFELLETVRVITPSIPLILFSADARETTKQQAMQAGAQAFFTKPFDLDLLVATITQLSQ